MFWSIHANFSLSTFGAAILCEYNAYFPANVWKMTFEWNISTLIKYIVRPAEYTTKPVAHPMGNQLLKTLRKPKTVSKRFPKCVLLLLMRIAEAHSAMVGLWPFGIWKHWEKYRFTRKRTQKLNYCRLPML